MIRDQEAFIGHHSGQRKIHLSTDYMFSFEMLSLKSFREPVEPQHREVHVHIRELPSLSRFVDRSQSYWETFAATCKIKKLTHQISYVETTQFIRTSEELSVARSEVRKTAKPHCGDTRLPNGSFSHIRRIPLPSTICGHGLQAFFNARASECIYLNVVALRNNKRDTAIVFWQLATEIALLESHAVPPTLPREGVH